MVKLGALWKMKSYLSGVVQISILWFCFLPMQHMKNVIKILTYLSFLGPEEHIRAVVSPQNRLTGVALSTGPPL